MPRHEEEEYDQEEVEQDEQEESGSPKKRKRNEESSSNKSSKTSHEDTTDTNVNNKVQVRNLSFNTSVETIKETFSQHGKVTNVEQNEEARGVAYVEFADKESAEAAVSAIDGSELDGRRIYCSIAGQSQPTIHVGNLPFSVDKDALEELFKECGTITDVRIPVFSDSQKPKGFAFVVFKEASAVEQAIKLNGESVEGREITVTASTGRGGGGGGRGGRGGFGGGRGGRGGFGGGRGGRGGFGGGRGGRGGFGGDRGGRGRGGFGGGRGGRGGRGGFRGGR